MSAFEMAVLIAGTRAPARFDEWESALEAAGVEVVRAETPPTDSTGPLLVVASRGAARNLVVPRASGPTVVLIDRRRGTPVVEGDVVYVHTRLRPWFLDCFAHLSTEDLAIILQRWLIRPNQIGPWVNDVVTYQILVNSVDAGRLVATGLCPSDTNVGPLQAAWSWNIPRADFPSTFSLEKMSDSGVPVRLDAWIFDESAFPRIADPADPTGFVAHSITRTGRSKVIGHFFNRTGALREQFWTTRTEELDSTRRFRDRAHLTFTVDPSAVPDAERDVTTWVPPQ